VNAFGGWTFEGRPLSTRDPNSQAAAAALAPDAPNRRALIWAIFDRSPEPLACWQVKEMTGIPHESVSSTIHYLQRKGALKRVGKNTTPNGNPAWTLVAVPNPDIEEQA
jgi:hypothetical protein